jgi:hypothetical protein
MNGFVGRLRELDILSRHLGDRHPTATHIGYAGTIKWRTRNPVTPSEVAHLRTSLTHLPGASPDTPIVAVCPAGIVDPSTLSATVDADWILARR